MKFISKSHHLHHLVHRMHHMFYPYPLSLFLFSFLARILYNLQIMKVKIEFWVEINTKKYGLNVDIRMNEGKKKSCSWVNVWTRFLWKLNPFKVAREKRWNCKIYFLSSWISYLSIIYFNIICSIEKEWKRERENLFLLNLDSECMFLTPTWIAGEFAFEKLLSQFKCNVLCVCFALCRVCIRSVNKKKGRERERCRAEKDADVCIEIEDELEFNVKLLVKSAREIEFTTTLLHLTFDS